MSHGPQRSGCRNLSPICVCVYRKFTQSSKVGRPFLTPLCWRGGQQAFYYRIDGDGFFYRYADQKNMERRYRSTTKQIIVTGRDYMRPSVTLRPDYLYRRCDAAQLFLRPPAGGPSAAYGFNHFSTNHSLRSVSVACTLAHE